MTRLMTVLFVCAALLLTVSTGWAGVTKEQAPWQYLPADVSPDAGPIANYEPVDLQWDLTWYSDAGATTGDNQLLGAEFAFNQFYITGGNLGGEPNKVYILDHDGALVTTFNQWSSAGWGWRDLAFDGTYLYASDDLVVDAFDATGNPVPGMNITGPVNPARALAYDPVLDHFWAQSFTTPLYEFTRAGTVIWSGSSGTTAYGAAWDEGAPDGPWLWIYSQTGTPQTTFHKFDPVGHAPTGFIYQQPLIPGSSDQIAGGAFMTEEWDPSLWLLGGMTQGTPNDMLFLLEMYPAGSGYRPAAPDNLTATYDPGGALSCDLDWDLPTTTVNGNPIGSYPITSVELMRDGSPLTSLGPTATSYTDTPPAAGVYEYAVYCINDSGNGIPATVNTPVGLDVPAGVTNLVGAGVDTFLIAELTWDPPTTGANGGYFPPGSITGYTIDRYGPSGASFTAGGTATSFTDNTVPVRGFYNYDVTPYNSTGNGPTMNTGMFYVGPPEYEPIPFDWVEINPAVPGAFPGTNTGITGDDQNLGPFNLGFVFPFYNSTLFNSIRVCSNGWLSFTSTSTAYSNQSIPNASEPNNLVAPYWDDFYPPGGGSIWYYADAANNRWICEFYRVPMLSGTGSYTFEAILYPNGDIDYMYQELTPGTPNSCTVGIENATGTVGIQATYNGSGPLEPAPMTGMRIYSVGTPPGTYDVTIDMTYNSGSPVPPGGGSINYDVQVTNNEAMAVAFDAWITVTIPTGPEITLLNRPLNLPAGGSPLRNLNLNVPAGAPAGNYTMTGHTGYYPSTVWNQDSFPFSKSGDGEGVFDPAAWTITGWDEPWDIATGAVIPDEYAVHGNYPNPFNPTTTISFDLPDAAKVTLAVYDVSGRLVTELVNGWRDAGVHEAVFDASGLASGVYVYRLTAGSFNATGKMVMMK